VRGNLAQGKGVLLKVPEGLFAARGFVHGGDDLVLVFDVDEESVVRTERELTLDLKIAVLKKCSEGDGIRHRLQVGGFERWNLPSCKPSNVSVNARSSWGRSDLRVPRVGRTAGRS